MARRKSNKQVFQMMLDVGFYDKWYYIDTKFNTSTVSIKANQEGV